MRASRLSILWLTGAVTHFSSARPLADGLAGLANVVSPPTLRFRKDGTLRISMFNDLHYGEGEANPPSMGWGPISDRRSTAVINTILDVERPDLAVLNGDLITGENTYAFNATKYLDQLVDPMVRRNIKWATTYGNHDADINISPNELLQREKQNWPGLSMTDAMVAGGVDEVGVSNYYIPVYSGDAHKKWDEPMLILWFFDSRGGKTRKGGSRESFVHPKVVDWFTKTRDSLNKKHNKIIPSLAFVHIPIAAMTAFQTHKGGIDPMREPGINADKPCSSQGVMNGWYKGADLPFAKALVGTQKLMGVFSGHDHGNDWCHKWNSDHEINGVRGNGLSFCFGRRTGYGGYGKWSRGSRSIFLTENSMDKGIETWISLEDRQQSGRIRLNEKYGQDNYALVRQTFST